MLLLGTQHRSLLLRQQQLLVTLLRGSVLLRLLQPLLGLLVLLSVVRSNVPVPPGLLVPLALGIRLRQSTVALQERRAGEAGRRASRGLLSHASPPALQRAARCAPQGHGFSDVPSLEKPTMVQDLGF
eukprot:GHVT01090028.1.p1 GENE.GHVT01090028.1~~GHVT01090028.1.p1  ORF type:complete len:128 (-),score=26.27 GHVT01090028.1:334-717(-)